MTNIKRRIEKLETKTELRKTQLAESQAKLLELERLEKQDSIQAILLRLELQLGRKVCFADIIRIADQARNKNDR